jgi:hypothetical protein
MQDRQLESPARVTGRVRNPFGVMDVPAPEDEDVKAFAAATVLDGGDDDVNAPAWAGRGEHRPGGNAGETLEGRWASRWNGGADPTMPADTAQTWKAGAGEVRMVGDFVYLLFSWDEGRRRGLIATHRRGAQLVGKYINLSTPSITRPWVGLIVDACRIDGRWTGGRLDFRR